MIFFSPFSMIMTRMLLSSSSFLVVFLLCLSHLCYGRHLISIDDHHAMDDINAKVLLSHSTIKGLENHPVTVHDDLNLNETKQGKIQTNRNVNYDHHMKQTDSESKNKKDVMLKDQKVKESKEEMVHLHQNQHHPKSITFQVPSKNKQVHDQQPGFNLDYSPPKTHPPSHN